MAQMRMFVFSVTRGLCVLVQTPSGHLCMIDCGRDPKSDNQASFSPATWIAQNFAGKATTHNGRLLTHLTITHPHDDHVEDIEHVISLLPPAILRRHKDLDWARVLNPPDCDPSRHAKTFYDWQRTYSRPADDMPDYGCSMTHFSLTKEETESTWAGTQQQLNNRSIVTVANWPLANSGYWRIVIMGDNETAGIRKLLEQTAFCDAIKGADFFVTPHHGYESAYCGELYEVMGKPFLNISSTRSGDDYVDPCYSSQARGAQFRGAERNHVTTRKDGHIVLTLSETTYAFG